ncbi:bifunctional folylpolyglutamate synthase/dihydrofolate synthase [Coraliomargarita parva]|uniref:bifunctional folylpolyglutamate synthase/dihydrofolate synthase n=1 Tax=Coraliomargarita parva TaxID=3014050 RepID=UPI0022B314BB|nr:folylpolyglutamate synthase/dihydrofolate synthase family protein [Coraliomargarita parva]
MSTYAQIREYLFSLRNRGSKYGIERMRRLVEALGHPERRFPILHVAGTNGKGSVCAMLEAIYRANGYRTGLFTSPHLLHLGERVQVDRQALSEAAILRYTEQLKPVAEELGARDPDDSPSFFEFMTAMAFLRFAEAEVDLGILETGLGGRLDSTNVVDPALTIITSVSLDHTDILGDSLDKIAREKAGILKPGIPVVLGRLPPEADTEIQSIAAERACPVYTVTEYFNEQSLPETNLEGAHQRWNAAVATLASRLLEKRFPLDPAKSEQALRAIEWAGRWQRLSLDKRTLILDATHNPEGAEALEANLQRLVETTGKKPHIIAGTLGEDRGRSLMAVLARYAGSLHLVEPAQPRACTREYLASCLPPESPLPVTYANVDQLFPQPQSCTLGAPGDIILVTGSIYLLGEVLERLQGKTASGGQLQDKI